MKLARTPVFERIRARLILRAVLPALGPLVAQDARARALAQSRRYAIKLSTLSGPSVTIACDAGQVRVDPHDAGPVLRLSFMSDRQVNKVFDQSGLTVPIPSGQLSYLRHVGVFQQLTARLEEVLKPAGALEPDEVRTRCSLMLTHLLPAAVAELANHEPETQSILSEYPSFSARIVVAGVSAGSIRRDATGRCTAQTDAPVREPPGERPDVRMTFANLSTATEAVDNTLDRLAALGSARLLVDGMTPLADDLGRVMERVDAYLR